MTELATLARETIIPPDVGKGLIVNEAVQQGWLKCEATTAPRDNTMNTTVWVDDESVLPPLDAPEVAMQVNGRAEKELFKWSENKDVAELLEDDQPAEWYVLGSGDTITHVLNFSSRELGHDGMKLIRDAHQKTSMVTGGASAQATKAIVITDQDFLGNNKDESRFSNGKASTSTGVVFLSERIFDPTSISTKEYVRDSGATQAEAVLAHEEVHEAQLGAYSPIIRSKYDHLSSFKSATGWEEHSYELPEGRYVITGVGNTALLGDEIELPVSGYGNVNPKEDTAEAGAAIVIGVDPGSIRSDSIDQLRDASIAFRPELANLDFSITERKTDIPLGSSSLDYPNHPMVVGVRFAQVEGD